MIFCVEDDETIGKMIKRHLEKWEYDVHVAKNLSQVMTEFAAFDPQLVLMDIRLPFYNGYYWCTEIRKVSNVPVIFLSSVADNMNIVMAMNMGGDDFIPKPFDLEVLTAKIQALLRRSRNHFLRTDTGQKPDELRQSGCTVLLQNLQKRILKQKHKYVAFQMKRYNPGEISPGFIASEGKKV